MQQTITIIINKMQYKTNNMPNKYNNHANSTNNNNNKIDKLWMILPMIWEHKV